MSYAVLRGEPYPSQLYLDGILDEILQARGVQPDDKEREKVCLAEIMYHCLKKNPNNIFMINGATGERITNEELLKQAVSLTRSLIARGATGKTAILMMRNHQNMTAMYYAVIFAGMLPFLIDPNTTLFELNHFLKLIEPTYLFCDEEHLGDVGAALESFPQLATQVVQADKPELLKEFAAGNSEDPDNFEFPRSSPDASVLLLPTSGSTGVPKAAIMTNRGLVTQLPITWVYHSQFPKPTDMVMVLTTLQWMTFTMMITTSIVYQIPILISPKPVTVENVKEMMLKYRPSWAFFGPAFMKSLLAAAAPAHFASLRSVVLLGAPSTHELMAAIREKIPASAVLCDAYGTTETQGYISLPDALAPVKSTGRVVNILEYKMLDENGKEVGLCQNGELFVRGGCTIKGYYKNEEAYRDSFEGGWLKTGDMFYIDENERLFYVQRIKFNFKHNSCHVSPEEVESVIASVAGVAESAVCATPRGAAAAVRALPGRAPSRRSIHAAVDATLSDHKRLFGGIVFVDSLPHTHSGKLKRLECQKLIDEHIKAGNCY